MLNLFQHPSFYCINLEIPKQVRNERVVRNDRVVQNDRVVRKYRGVWNDGKHGLAMAIGLIMRMTEK
jgi:hypothetical protein